MVVWCSVALGEKKDAGLFFAEFACSHGPLTWHLQPHPTVLRPTRRLAVLSKLPLRSCEIELALVTVSGCSFHPAEMDSAHRVNLCRITGGKYLMDGRMSNFADFLHYSDHLSS